MVFGWGKNNDKINLSSYEEGEELAKKGKYEEAIMCFDKITKVNNNFVSGIDPEYVDAQIEKGRALDKLKKYEEAIICFNEAIEIDAYRSMAWFSRGCALFYLDEHILAIQNLDEAFRLDPKSTVAQDLSKDIKENLAEALDISVDQLEKKIKNSLEEENAEYSSKTNEEVNENEKNEPIDVLKMRLAKGEISLDEFNELKDVL